MHLVKLRDSLLEKLRDSGHVYTLNCLENLNASLNSLTVHNHVLETILLSSRRAIAQHVHLFSHVLQEVTSFVEHEYVIRECPTKDAPSDPLSTRIRFLNRLDDIHTYVDSYLASFRTDYHSLVLCANQFDYHEGSNSSFVSALQTCKSLTELDLLVDGHGGQVDFHDDYLPVLSRFHSTFSFTRNLLRDASDSHAMADQLELFLPSLFDYLEHFSRLSIPCGKNSKPLDFLERSSKFISCLKDLDFKDTCALFRISDHRASVP